MARHKRNDPLGMTSIDDAKQDYRIAKRTGAQNRQRRGVPSQGAGADYHYRTESDWLWMQEVSWDLYRNNMALGSITDRAIENTLQGGFVPNFDSGDEKLDRDVEQWWQEVREDPQQCDVAGEDAFPDQEEFALRSTQVGGDVFALPMGDEHGTLQMREGYLCRSPSSTRVRERIVHGIEKQPGTLRRRNYWLMKDAIDPHKQGFIKKSDLQPTPAYYHDELTGQPERNVFHVRFAKRPSQTRGITAYAPLYDPAAYHDDVQFLKMVQQRAASLFVFVRERATTFDPEYLAAEQSYGRDVTQDKASTAEAAYRQYAEVAPGTPLSTLPGEKILPWSANVPNPEWFAHTKMLLTFMGINLGMPLVMALMDASETNFSGYRGAVDQARMGFRANQRRLIRRFHKPYMRFRLLKRAERDPAFMRVVERSLRPTTKINVFRFGWIAPGWPYIEPVKDATAGLIRLANSLTSPRRYCNEVASGDWATLQREIREDRWLMIKAAYKEAIEFANKLGRKDDWSFIDSLVQRIAPLPMPERVQISISGDAQSPAQPQGALQDESAD